MIPRPSGNGWIRSFQLFGEIVRGRYDLVVILPSIPVYRFAARLAMPRRLVYVPQAPDGAHMAEHMLRSVAEQLGLSAPPARDSEPTCNTSAAARPSG